MKTNQNQNQFYQCLFPARYKILSNLWPNLFNTVECPKFDKWVKGLDVENVYLVFTSVYPNNPASMFGHTFLRFDRKSRGKLERTKEKNKHDLEK